MIEPNDIRKSLIDVDDSVLVVVDIQDHFLNKLEHFTSQSLVIKTAWIIQVAGYLSVPVVVMGENIKKVGPVSQPILDALPDGTAIHDKDFYGLADNPHILAAVEATGRKTAVLVGMETDVCVAQSALGLIGVGYQVAVLKDAVATTAGGEEIGLARMQGAGALISSVKALYYEWQRSVSNCRTMREKFPNSPIALRPDNLTL